MKPEKGSGCLLMLTSLSSFSANAYLFAVPALSSLPRNASCCFARKRLALIRSFKISRFSLTFVLCRLTLSLRCSSKAKSILEIPNFSKQSDFECEWLIVRAYLRFSVNSSCRNIHSVPRHCRLLKIEDRESRKAATRPVFTSVPLCLKRTGDDLSISLKQIS